MKLKNYVQGQWVEGSGKGTPLYHAVTGETVAYASTEGLDFKGILEYGRNVGGPKLRRMTFHERARMLKALALHLMAKKEIFYELSYATGATRTDSWIDIEGGIGTMLVFASKGRRELPDEPFLVDGAPEQISKQGTFLGRHICVPLEGVALHINAFNFPCWGMLEKIAPALLAGVPCVVKPATLTSYLTELMFREMIASGILPEGAVQLICGSAGDIMDYLTGQDVVTLTGSASTGHKLKSHPRIISESVRFNMEADSLNCSVLGPDAVPGTPEFDLFVKEVVREMTVKAGQKCTAIRRVFVPESMCEDVIAALKKRLAGNTIGNPLTEGVRMGPLAGHSQVKEVREKIAALMEVCEIAYGDLENYEVVGADKTKGAFLPPILLFCPDPLHRTQPHDIEAFGPVATVMGYHSTEEAIELTKMGKGSLVGSIFTYDNRFAKEMVLGTAAYHGRLFLMNRDSAQESTGHGSPLGHLVHGGPGRAGGGEELGGIRGVMHYMQRTAVQASPEILTAITNQYHKGAKPKGDHIHPFRKYFEDLQIGETYITHRRTITEADIVNFANLSWDHFYAHTDTTALEGSVFEQRVAHGYFVISAAAGLFVDPARGPVLANYGLDEFRFIKPVYAGSTIGVRLIVKEKTAKERKPDTKPQGVVKWLVDVYDQTGETVAIGTILTLVEMKG